VEVPAFLQETADPYNRQARLFPGFIITLPVTVLAIVIFTAAPAWWSGAVVVMGGSGLTYFGAQLVRGAGRHKEECLWESWGGPPTTQLLRFRGPDTATAVQRRHDLLARILPDLPIADRVTEEANPKLADEQYKTAVDAIIARTRDKARFRRVFDELCQYGFRRNLWGCRKFGFWTSGFAIALTAGALALKLLGLVDVSVLGIIVAIGVNAMLLVALEFVVKPEWVREAADAYARQLLATLEILVTSSEASAQRTGNTTPENVEANP
jgi:hypothetical protein